MARYVNAEDLKAAIKAKNWSNPVVPSVVCRTIDHVASADVTNVRHGSWIVIDADDGMGEEYCGFIEFQCSECGLSVDMESGEYDWHYGDPIPWKFCPICGALMDGERKEG